MCDCIISCCLVIQLYARTDNQVVSLSCCLYTDSIVHCVSGGEKSPVLTTQSSDDLPVSSGSPVHAPVYTATTSRPKSAPSSKCRKVAKEKEELVVMGYGQDKGHGFTNTGRGTLGDMKSCSEAGRMCLSARDAYIDRSPTVTTISAVAAPSSSSSGDGGNSSSNFNRPSRGSISLQVDVDMDTDNYLGIDNDGDGEIQDRYISGRGLNCVSDNEDSESVSQKIDQLILEAQQLQEKKLDMVRGKSSANSQKGGTRGRRGADKEKGVEKGSGDVRSAKVPHRRAGSSRCPASYSEVDGTYGESLSVPSSATSVARGDVAWSDSLATSRPSDVFSTITLSSQKQSINGTYSGMGVGVGLGGSGSWTGQRRVSFGNEATSRNKLMAGIASKEDLESRARDTLVSKLLLNREVEEGSSKQVRGREDAI